MKKIKPLNKIEEAVIINDGKSSLEDDKPPAVEVHKVKQTKNDTQDTIIDDNTTNSNDVTMHDEENNLDDDFEQMLKANDIPGEE